MAFYPLHPFRAVSHKPPEKFLRVVFTLKMFSKCFQRIKKSSHKLL